MERPATHTHPLASGTGSHGNGEFTLKKRPSSSDILRKYEHTLVLKYRFALSQLVFVLVEILSLFKQFRTISTTASTTSTCAPAPSAAASCSKAANIKQQQQDSFEHLVANACRRLSWLQEQVPVFLGHHELNGFLRVFRDNVRVSDLEFGWDLQMDAQQKAIWEQLFQVVTKLHEMQSCLHHAMDSVAPTTSLLTKKKERLRRMLEESLELMENFHSNRLTHLESKKKSLLEKYQLAVQAIELREEKQLVYEIQSIEVSMLTMLFPHLEICRTITTANAQLKKSCFFKKEERAAIESFIRNASKLKKKSVPFERIVTDPVVFLKQLRLFERAAKKDLFVVCSSVLKLQFQESFDDELFSAYFEDWRNKQVQLQVLQQQDQFLDASQTLENLKQQVIEIQLQIQNSTKNLSSDDSLRQNLCKEIERVFEEEGGSIDGRELFYSQDSDEDPQDDSSEGNNTDN